MDRCIYLIGLMGSGKSTVGHLLAQRIGCEYVDNDATIARLAGRSTVALAEAGGTLLHDWESRYISHVRALPAPAVVGIPASTSEKCLMCSGSPADRLARAPQAASPAGSHPPRLCTLPVVRR